MLRNDEHQDSSINFLLSKNFLKADLHGTILSHATSLRHVLGHDCHKVLKHVFKSYDFFLCRKQVACDKTVPCKSAFRLKKVLVRNNGMLSPREN